MQVLLDVKAPGSIRKTITYSWNFYISGCGSFIEYFPILPGKLRATGHFLKVCIYFFKN